jgi:hypothetical protein
MKKIILLVMLLAISIGEMYGQQKEDVYIIVWSAKYWGTFPISFVIVDNDSTFVTTSFDIDFSRKNKKVKKIHKIRNYLTERFKFTKMENGNILEEYILSEKGTAKREFYSTENFRKTHKYEVYQEYLPELLSKDNYELLEYLDSHFTRYSGPKEYRDAPLLKKRE